MCSSDLLRLVYPGSRKLEVAAAPFFHRLRLRNRSSIQCIHPSPFHSASLLSRFHSDLDGFAPADPYRHATLRDCRPPEPLHPRDLTVLSAHHRIWMRCSS